MGNIKLSASTFSAGHLFATGQMDMEAFVKTVAEIGYTGIELVSAQLAPGYPYPSDEWIDQTAAMLKRYNMEMAAYGGYVDMVRYQGRDLTDAEIRGLARNDIVIAHRLGSKVLKTGEHIGVQNLRALLPDCERWGVWIGLELHGPEDLHGELWKGYMELFREDGGAHFGIVPDTGIFQELPNEMFRRESLEAGISEARYDAIEQAFAARQPLDGPQCTLALNGAEAAVAKKMVGEFSHNQLADLDVCFQYAKYTHGKFFYLDEQCKDRGIDFARIVAAMKRQDYDGFISAEYEGYFHDISVDTVEQLRRYYKLMSALIV